MGGTILRGSHHSECRIFYRIARVLTGYIIYVSTSYLEVVTHPMGLPLNDSGCQVRSHSLEHSLRDCAYGCALTTDTRSKSSSCLRHSGDCDCSSDSNTDTSLGLGIFPDLFFVRGFVMNVEVCRSKIPTFHSTHHHACMTGVPINKFDIPCAAC